MSSCEVPKVPRNTPCKPSDTWTLVSMVGPHRGCDVLLTSIYYRLVTAKVQKRSRQCTYSLIKPASFGKSMSNGTYRQADKPYVLNAVSVTNTLRLGMIRCIPLVAKFLTDAVRDTRSAGTSADFSSSKGQPKMVLWQEGWNHSLSCTVSSVSSSSSRSLSDS